MSLKGSVLFCLFLCAGFFCFGRNPGDASFIKTEDGILVTPDPAFSGGAARVRLQVVAENIIRVLALPSGADSTSKSFITVYKKDPSVKWDVVPGKDVISLRTRELVATVTLRTGAVAFFDTRGRRLLGEEAGGRTLKPAVFEGKPSWGIRQAFRAPAGDAWYGLGQHQDDIYNYRTRPVFLWQNNTEVAIPFLISSKNYGVLWDNNSLTQAGDGRSFRPLSSLELFDKEGTPGWLTASYANDQKKPEAIAFRRAESAINYEWLGDSKRHLPDSFNVANGSITWEGSFRSAFDDVHSFRFTYGGYLKVWLNGKEVLDRWREAWNPAPALVDFPVKKGTKNSIRIQWIPAGSESYLTARWLEPSTQPDVFAFDSEAGQRLDYYFISGTNMDSVIAGYRKLTGPAVMMPKWVFGKWQSRERYKTEKELVETVAEFRKRRIPLDNIVQDWSYWKEAEWGSQEFDPARFPNFDSAVRTLHDQYHTRVMISVWPKFYEGIPAYNEFNRKGWLYRRNVADRQRDWIGKGYVSTFYDVFNEEAQKGFWDLLNEKLYTKGVDAWWMDASEPDILSNVSPEKRKDQMLGTAAGPAAEVLNAYPLLNAKGIYEGQRATKPGSRVFILTRSGFPGLQRYAAATWSGDIGARWHDMKAQISAGLNFSMSGLPYWTMDIGGFVVEPRFHRPNAADQEEWRELQTRWYQFGAFVPLFRVHGQFPFREIYNTAPEGHPAYSSMLYYDHLRYRLLPYIYSLAGKTYHQHYTLMRGLAMDFPGDPRVAYIGDQYLFGPSLLVNPVYTYKERQRKLYLPAGTGWYDFYSGAYRTGGQDVTADAPYERMPLYVREGSILPMGPELQYTDEKQADTITLYVYTGRDASFTLYEDEGVNYNYEKGQFATIDFQYNELKKTLTIRDRKGSFPGMLQQRTFEVVWVSKDRPAGFDPARTADARVTYTGKAITVNRKP
ncbi:MAG TPA: TIM-barrel domain-containing protein [Chitinophagaceae bacterium]|jgi:alpha-D-xyloside xylohydrolase|nr:TIM-barrel domain-containing protein [Chitinophagaceae bacterium]